MDLKSLSDEELLAEDEKRRDAVVNVIRRINERMSKTKPGARSEEEMRSMSLRELRKERRMHTDSIATRKQEEVDIDRAFDSIMATRIEVAARRVAAKLRSDRLATGGVVDLDLPATARAEALIGQGLGSRVAYVMAAVEADLQGYLGDRVPNAQLLDDMASDAWNGATKDTAMEVFVRRISEVAIERLEQYDERLEGPELETLQQFSVLRDIKDRALEQRWTDAMLTEAGVLIWNQTYRAGQDDAAVLSYCEKLVERWQAEDDEEGQDESANSVIRDLLAFSAKWAVHAFQRITTTHTYAAALMCTDADRESLETIETQWHAFMVQVPNGLLRVAPDLEYNRVLVRMGEGQAAITLIDQNNRTNHSRILDTWAATLADVLGNEDESFVGHSDWSPESARAMVLAKRLVAGLLLAMQHVDNFKSKTYPAREKRRDGRMTEEPSHRMVMVGTPISVDCRPAVADYIAVGSKRKGGAPPSVQVIVRGHYKRQVIGIGRSGRKVIWVQPYWRGPDGAPILTHPKRIGRDV